MTNLMDENPSGWEKGAKGHKKFNSRFDLKNGKFEVVAKSRVTTFFHKNIFPKTILLLQTIYLVLPHWVLDFIHLSTSVYNIIIRK